MWEGGHDVLGVLAGGGCGEVPLIEGPQRADQGHGRHAGLDAVGVDAGLLGQDLGDGLFGAGEQFPQVGLQGGAVGQDRQAVVVLGDRGGGLQVPASIRRTAATADSPGVRWRIAVTRSASIGASWSKKRASLVPK